MDARPVYTQRAQHRCGVLRLSIGSSYGGWWTVREEETGGARDGERGRGEAGKGRTQPAEERSEGVGRGERWTVGALMNQFKCMR